MRPGRPAIADQMANGGCHDHERPTSTSSDPNSRSRFSSRRCGPRCGTASITASAGEIQQDCSKRRKPSWRPSGLPDPAGAARKAAPDPACLSSGVNRDSGRRAIGTTPFCRDRSPVAWRLRNCCHLATHREHRADSCVLPRLFPAKFIRLLVLSDIRRPMRRPEIANEEWSPPKACASSERAARFRAGRFAAVG